MHKFVLVFAIAALVFAVSCTDAAPPVKVENTAPARPAPPKTEHADDGHDDAPRITLAEAKKDFDAGRAVLIDVRDEASYKQEHVKGALHITTASLDAKFNDIPKGKKIIAYCS